MQIGRGILIEKRANREFKSRDGSWKHVPKRKTHCDFLQRTVVEIDNGL